MQRIRTEHTQKKVESRKNAETRYMQIVEKEHVERETTCSERETTCRERDDL